MNQDHVHGLSSHTPSGFMCWKKGLVWVTYLNVDVKNNKIFSIKICVQTVAKCISVSLSVTHFMVK